MVYFLRNFSISRKFRVVYDFEKNILKINKSCEIENDSNTSIFSRSIFIGVKMVKPATQRRRTKVQQAQLQAQQLAAQQQAQKQKEDEIGGMHDEADVMSFRSAATHRFILNQELIENVTEKWVHTDSIIKPKPFAHFQTTKENIDDIKDELYFGNVKLMRQKVEQLEKELEEAKQVQDVQSTEKHNNAHLREILEQMAKSGVNDDPSTIEKSSKSFKETFKKSVVDQLYSIRSLPNLNNNTAEAPANYWEEIAKAREEQAANAENNLVISNQEFTQEDPAQNVQEQLQYVEAPPAFESEDINMIDDVGFGLHSTLDDHDFLSQIDHSME